MHFLSNFLILHPWLVLLGVAFLLPPLRARSTGQGFGGATAGGDLPDTTLLWVTSLEDNPKNPEPGTFRWAVLQKQPRIVRFKVAGDIILKDRVFIKGSDRGHLTVDGSDAPGLGVCLRGAEIALRETEEIIFRHVRIRRGRDGVGPFPAKPARQGSSTNLDCLELKEVKNVLFDHVSFSWSCDELVGITHSQSVTFQWCIFAEPLGDVTYSIHPYGTNHSAALNISSSTVSIHHSLLSNFRFRGPQFEANDVRKSTPVANRTVKLESVNNLIFNYSESGGRYSTAADGEGANATPKDAKFYFHFVNNRYLSRNYATLIPEIAASESARPDTSGRLRVYVSGNIGPNRPHNSHPETAVVFFRNKQGKWINLAEDKEGYRKQLSPTPLFTHPADQQITLDPVDDTLCTRVLRNAGARPHTRDAVDTRIVLNLVQPDKTQPYPPTVKDPEEVGGWPALATAGLAR